MGLVLSIAELRAQRNRACYESFEAHPVVADAIEGGEVVEYSAHVVSSGDKRAMPRELTPMELIAGEAANLLLNAGKAIGDGLCHAVRNFGGRNVLEAKQPAIFGGETGRYRKKRMPATL